MSVNHRYAFRLFALNSSIKLKPSAGRIEFNKAIEGKILAETKLIAEYVKSVQAPPLTATPGISPPTAASPPWQPARLQALNEDKEFILETARCRADLVEAHKQDSEIIERFFHRHSFTSAFAEAKTRAYLAKIKDQKIRRVLEDYVRYANRFRVQFRLKTKPLDFKILLRLSYGERFHVKIVGGHLEGLRPRSHGEAAFVDTFSSESVSVPDATKELIDAGKATYVRIDDHGGYSILKELEDIAYKDDGVAIIHHHAEQPYFICIFGEKTKKDVLADLGRSLTDFQREYYYRSQGGRPANMDTLMKRVEAAAKRMSNKEKAADLAEGGGDKQIKAQEVKLSQLGSKLRKSKRR